MKPYFRLSEIERLPASQFTHENSFAWCMQPTPLRFTEAGIWQVMDGWKIVGWNPLSGSDLMASRSDDNIAMMLFHPDEGNLWQHVPIGDYWRDKPCFQVWDLLEQ